MYFQNYEPNIAVCDVGTEFIKMGYATHNSPSFYSNTANSHNNYISPLRHSNIIDIPSYLQILNTLDLFATKDILITLNDEKREVKSKIIEYLYENHICDNLLFHENRICDLYSYGKTNGIVINLSSSVSVVAILDGLVVSRRDDLFGGYDATKIVKTRCAELGLKIHEKKDESRYSMFCIEEKARLIKENIFNNIYNSSEVVYQNDLIDVKNEIISRMVKNINKYICEIIESMDDELKYQMLSNIVLSGGCSEIQGMHERINEVICETYPQSKVKITYEKKFHTFLGASVFGSLGSTRCFYMGKADYEEFGVNILDRKTFNWTK